MAEYIDKVRDTVIRGYFDTGIKSSPVTSEMAINVVTTNEKFVTAKQIKPKSYKHAAGDAENKIYEKGQYEEFATRLETVYTTTVVNDLSDKNPEVVKFVGNLPAWTAEAVTEYWANAMDDVRAGAYNPYIGSEGVLTDDVESWFAAEDTLRRAGYRNLVAILDGSQIGKVRKIQSQLNGTLNGISSVDDGTIVSATKVYFRDVFEDATTVGGEVGRIFSRDAGELYVRAPGIKLTRSAEGSDFVMDTDQYKYKAAIDLALVFDPAGVYRLFNTETPSGS